MKRKKAIYILMALSIFVSMNVCITAGELSEKDKKEAYRLIEKIRKEIKREEKAKEKALREEAKRKEIEEKKRLEEEEKQRKLEEEQRKMEEAQLKTETEEIVVDVPEEVVEVVEIDTDNSAQVVPVEKMSKEQIIQEYILAKEKAEREKKKEIKNSLEKLKETQTRVNEKVDFYERVVRSVAREEADINSHKDILEVSN